MLAAADLLHIGKSVGFRTFHIPLKHISTFSSVWIPITKEMNVTRKADLQPKRLGTVQAFYVFGSSTTSCFPEHRI